MRLNPEFRRQLWSELSPFRLVAMPVFLGFVVACAYAVAGARRTAADVAPAISLTFMMLMFPWGARLAADGLAVEFRDRTWDAQRMTSLRPWSMAWGKLIGGPILAWYGAAFCIAIYLLTSPLSPSLRLESVAWGIAAGLGVHAAVLLWTLLALRKRGRLPSREIGLSTLLGLIALPPFWIVGSWFSKPPAATELEWYGTVYSGTHFALSTAVLSTGWAVLAFYRTLRAELGLRNLPWAWLGFTLFVMVWAVGFVSADPDAPYDERWLRWAVAYGVAVGAVYAAAFAEPVDWIRARRLARAWQQRDLVMCLGEVPRWSLSFALAVGVALAWIAWSIANAADRLAVEIATIVAVMALVARDMALRLGLHASPTPRRRADGAMLVLLAVLYLLIPYTARDLDARDVLLYALWPGGWFLDGSPPHSHSWLVAGLPLVQAAAALAWFVRRRGVARWGSPAAPAAPPSPAAPAPAPPEP